MTPTGVISASKGVKRNRSSTSSSTSSRVATQGVIGCTSRNKSRKRQNGGCCKARLVVTIGRLTPTSNDRWFVSVRDGVHTGHPVVTCSLLAKPMRLLDSSEMEIAADALSSHSGSGVARALFFYRTGDLIQRNVLRRLTMLRSNASMGLLPTEQVSEADRLVAQMRGDPSIDYLMFYHESGSTRGIVTELGLTGEDVTTSLLPLSSAQLIEIENVRKATRLSPSSHMLVSVMWVRRDERTLFRCNPSVLFIDFTANTNVEKKPFFMGTGVTATNESVVAFRALTPNEKLQWTDNIMSALPRLLGTSTFKKVSMGIGDECGNEIKSVLHRPLQLPLYHFLPVRVCFLDSFNCLSFLPPAGPGKRAVRTSTMALCIGYVACTKSILVYMRKHSLVNFTTSTKVPPG